MGSNSNKDWSKNETEELIKAYEKQSALWDRKHSDFNNRLLKITSWFVLSQKFDTSVEEIQRKIHNLRNQFNCEMKKTLKRKSDNEEESYISKWIYFNQMMFLRHSLEHRCSRGNSVNSPNTNHVEDQNERSRKRTFSESNDTVTTNIENSQPQVEFLKKKKIRKAQKQRDFLQETLRTLSEKDDEYEIFGKYVSSELRSLTNNILRKRMKRKIQEVIVAIQKEEDEQFSLNKFFSYNNRSTVTRSAEL